MSIHKFKLKIEHDDNGPQAYDVTYESSGGHTWITRIENPEGDDILSHSYILECAMEALEEKFIEEQSALDDHLYQQRKDKKMGL